MQEYTTALRDRRQAIQDELNHIDAILQLHNGVRNGTPKTEEEQRALVQRITQRIENDKISVYDACKAEGIGETSYYKYRRELEAEPALSAPSVTREIEVVVDLKNKKKPAQLGPHREEKEESKPDGRSKYTDNEKLDILNRIDEAVKNDPKKWGAVARATKAEGISDAIYYIWKNKFKGKVSKTKKKNEPPPVKYVPEPPKKDVKYVSEKELENMF